MYGGHYSTVDTLECFPVYLLAVCTYEHSRWPVRGLLFTVVVPDCVGVLHSKQKPYSVNFQPLEVNFSSRVPIVLELWHPAIVTPDIWNSRCFVSV